MIHDVYVRFYLTRWLITVISLQFLTYTLTYLRSSSGRMVTLYNLLFLGSNPDRRFSLCKFFHHHYSQNRHVLEPKNQKHGTSPNPHRASVVDQPVWEHGSWLCTYHAWMSKDNLIYLKKKTLSRLHLSEYQQLQN